MTTDEFFKIWNSRGLDYDGVYKNQCVDVFLQYNHDVVGGPKTSGNAIDYWTEYPTAFYDKIVNTPINTPLKGDVVIWGKGVGQFGHIAICSEANLNSFISFDQNWPAQVDANGNGLGVCHFQAHNYNSVLGWLRPKVQSIPIPPSPPVSIQGLIPLEDVITNTFRALCGVDGSQDERNYNNNEIKNGKPLSSVMEDKIRGDQRFKDRWSYLFPQSTNSPKQDAILAALKRIGIS